MVQKKTEKSPANPGSLCRDDSAWPQAEQGRKASQGNSQDTSVSKMENAGTYLARWGKSDLLRSQPPMNHERI
jgi:hypothetical protein